MPWRENKVEEQRVEFIVRAVKGESKIRALCQEYGISRPTGYRWIRRYYEAGGLAEVGEYSRRPKHSPKKTPLEIEKKVLELKEQYGWGARKLHQKLNQMEIGISPITVHRILKRNGAIQKSEGVNSAKQRFEYEEPNELWQMDFKGQYSVGERGWCYPLTILDDHSRYAVSLTVHRNTEGEKVWAVLERTFQEYGIPEKMLMDHGTPWWGGTNEHGLTWLSVNLIKQGIELCHGRVRHPQTQGKVERFHRTLKEYFKFHGKPETYREWEEGLRYFRGEYNNERPHEALRMDVPARHYQPSLRKYKQNPEAWEYPSDVKVCRLNNQGVITYGGKRYFVCEALKNEWVGYVRLPDHLLVCYRNVYIREIKISTGRSKAMVIERQNFERKEN